MRDFIIINEQIDADYCYRSRSLYSKTNRDNRYYNFNGWYFAHFFVEKAVILKIIRVLS